ncbi:zinc finger protein ZAT9-like [Vicia villosa]|uniref:zinc finger protein ZAT9-like n=1 Tax=Vicia villosa TaxID=3911 RepID=UPI00273C554C|nr:zinc finger protein ZAT9-like [Vicia villosa]
MEKHQTQELKHSCKFCTKTFPCGRSLGGHMRSHINNLSSSSEKTELKQKLDPINNNGCIGSETNGSYGLRENPKKTWRKRIADSGEERLVYDKFCKECGKCFQSWKALFGHMKCHSEKERVCNSLEDQDSGTNNTKDVQSDNEITAPSRKRRSKRTRTRYNSIVAAAAATVTARTCSSVSEVEQEQEEVAMSLIMLSKDASPWSGLAESSDNNSVYIEHHRSSVRTNLVTKFNASNKNLTTATASTSTMNIAKLMKQKSFNFKGKSSEILDTEKGFKIKGAIKSTKLELDYVSTMDDSEAENGKNIVNGTESVTMKSYGEFIGERGKFECTTCNKIFHSYQALGGHRASHKKNKGCFASKMDNNEFENDLSQEPTTESKIMKIIHSHNSNEHVQNMKIKGHHECPICFKVFQSGQALGGHKRSHMVVPSSGGGSEIRVPQIRDFLDLNLPADATEEGSSSHADSNRPWWIVESNHKQEALVG